MNKYMYRKNVKTCMEMTHMHMPYKLLDNYYLRCRRKEKMDESRTEPIF